MDPILRRIFAVGFHSIETQGNTDYSRQIGRGLQARQISHIVEQLPDGVNDRGTVTAYELKVPTDDDRVSVEFAPSDTIFRHKMTYLCLPRAVWLDLVKRSRSPLKED